MKEWLKKFVRRTEEAAPRREDLAAWLRKGYDHQVRGELDQAQTLYRRILDQDPSSPDALYFLALIAEHEGREDEAIDLFHRAAEARPGDAEFRFGLAGVYFNQDRFPAAAEAFQAGIALNPHFPDMRANLAISLIDGGRTQEGLAELERLRHEGSDSVQVQNCFGRVYREYGRIDESIREFRRVLASDETNVHAWSNLLLTLQYSQDVGPEELY
ncbi:MAG: tetratricopeptide repeat protein, partial [Betaproteobacteria bacterium]|nr:tetratricopeptide repeat protein [Betaproteobacteria bacterium]